jgi:hypothetical protein
VTTVVVAVSVLIFVAGIGALAWAITAFLEINGLPEQVFQIVGRKKSNWLVLILVAPLPGTLCWWFGPRQKVKSPTVRSGGG